MESTVYIILHCAFICMKRNVTTASSMHFKLSDIFRCIWSEIKVQKRCQTYLSIRNREREPCDEMPDSLYFECIIILNNAIETITQEITSFSNKLDALIRLNLDNKTVIKSYQKIVKELRNELKN